MWPKTHAAQQQVCQDIRSSQDLVADYAQARLDCGTGGQLSATLKSAPAAYQGLVLTNGNIAWKALQQNSWLQNDPELAELLMSLSGTVIIQNPGNSDTADHQYKVLPSSLVPWVRCGGLRNGLRMITRCRITKPLRYWAVPISGWAAAPILIPATWQRVKPFRGQRV